MGSYNGYNMQEIVKYKIWTEFFKKGKEVEKDRWEAHTDLSASLVTYDETEEEAEDSLRMWVKGTFTHSSFKGKEI